MSGFQPNRNYVPQKREKPYRVVGGVRVDVDKGAHTKSWAGQRLMRLIEGAAPGDRLTEGLEYARMGQTRRIEFDLGVVRAAVQGRVSRAHQTTVRVATLAADEWSRATDAMADQAAYAARLLSGELPANIEDAFAPLGLRLFPSEPGELTPSCSCADENPWCKHAVCALTITAHRLGDDPLLIFTLRGLRGDDLLARLRQRRAETSAGRMGPGQYAPRTPALSRLEPAPLESLAHSFWAEAEGLEDLDTAPRPPEVRHALLRRLGASPFKAPSEGGFPLVGLLATCYDLVRESALQLDEVEPEERAEEGEP
ncbi:MAG: hypothetical protein IBJ10_11350 [Phycisphaerales bacterium]|nr:hypothetical protein [Phycisphaerales bacterium]